MADETIKSRGNALVKRARAVRDGKDERLVFVEGVRLCEDAARARLSIHEVFHTTIIERDARGAQLLFELRRGGGRLVAVSEDVLASISDTSTPQGIVALAERPPTGRDALIKDDETPLVVVLHRVGNPSNAGAMLRVVEASGATAAIATEGTTDLFSPKALRGAMGSTFRLPLWTGARFADALAWCASHGVETVSTDVRAARSHTQIDWTTPRAVILGAEGHGLSDAESVAADASIKIPMRPPVESLNVAVALAVVLYEAARQRERGER